jgi:SAM-dependent methyltransferase
MSHQPADWQLPPGVSRPTWDYVHDERIAAEYDGRLAGSRLLTVDMELAHRHFVSPGRLVDLGCGTGRLAIDFAGRGFAVLGVDLSEEMLRVAAGKAAQAGVAVEFLRVNLVELEALADASFDYAACLFSTLGMIDGAEYRQRAVGHVHRLLRSGGKFLLHVHNRWFQFWDKEGRKWLLGDVVRSLVNRSTAGDRVMPAHQGVACLRLHHFTRREAVALLSSAGFRSVEVHPLSLRPDGRLKWPAWFGWLRSYGYLLLATK